MKIETRAARLEDLDWLIEQLKAFAREFPSKLELFPGDEFARQGMTGYIREHLVLIAEREDGARLGFIAGVLAPHFFNPRLRTLAELFWWVPEEFRGTRAGLLLLNAFDAYGEKHADWVVMSLETGSPVRDKSLHRRGYVEHERSFLKEVV
jgi:RimJ/RimL family protein N-acetyltransferase